MPRETKFPPFLAYYIAMQLSPVLSMYVYSMCVFVCCVCVCMCALNLKIRILKLINRTNSALNQLCIISTIFQKKRIHQYT